MAAVVLNFGFVVVFVRESRRVRKLQGLMKALFKVFGVRFDDLKESGSTKFCRITASGQS